MKDWTLGTLLGGIGVPIVVLAALGWAPTPIALTLWTLAGIGWVLTAQRLGERPWLTVIVAGIASGFWAGTTQALLLPALVANDAAWAAFTVDAAGRAQAFWSAIPIGIVWGLLFAGITWVVGYVQARRRPAMA